MGLPLLAVLGALTIAGAVVASGVLFTQTIPSVPVNQPALTANCSSLTASPSSVAPGSSGDIGFSCNGMAAFQVAQADVAVTPTFSLSNTGYSDLWVFPSGYSIASSCSNTWGAIQLMSGQSVKFSQSGGWFYCADFMNAQSLGMISVSWSQ